MTSGDEHVQFSINDMVELFDGYTAESLEGEESTKRKPPKGEAWGLTHHLQKLLGFLISLRLKDKVDEVHVYNWLFFVLKLYRSEDSRDIGLHYSQALVDRLHKTSWWKSQGTLRDNLLKPNKEVVEELRKHYPAPRKPSNPGPPGGDFTKGKKGGGKTGKPGQWQPWVRGDQKSTRNRSRTRSRSRKRSPNRKGNTRGYVGGDSPGGGTQGGKNGGTGKGTKSHPDPRVQKAFILARDGKKVCPWFQTNTCLYGSKCQYDMLCHICKSSRHGAVDCSELGSAKAKKLLGV
jgi:hypothetical protein